jgi:hypothetical protein
MGAVLHFGDGEKDVISLQLSSNLILGVIMLEDLVSAVGDDDDDELGIEGAHLIDCVHEGLIGVIVQDKQDDVGGLGLVTVDQGNGTMLHLAGSQYLLVDIVQLLHLQSCFLRHC